MKTVYIQTNANKAPEKSDTYFCFDPNGFIKNSKVSLRFDISTGRWFNGSDEYHPDIYLSPVEVEDLVSDEEIKSKSLRWHKKSFENGMRSSDATSYYHGFTDRQNQLTSIISEIDMLKAKNINLERDLKASVSVGKQLAEHIEILKAEIEQRKGLEQLISDVKNEHSAFVLENALREKWLRECEDCLFEIFKSFPEEILRVQLGVNFEKVEHAYSHLKKGI